MVLTVGSASFMDPVMNPLLALTPFWAVFIITVVITLIITVVYKYATDQKKMKALRADLKKLQKKMQQVAKTDPQKAMSMQKEAMSKNGELMKHSFKPMLYTFLPIIIIFGWLNAHMAYWQLMPGEEFSVTLEFVEGKTGQVAIAVVPPENIEILGPSSQEIVNGTVTWALKGGEGVYSVGFKYQNEQYDKDVLISTERFYAPPEKVIKEKSLSVKKIIISNEPIRPFGNISLFGWRPGWLGAYIILSLILSTVFRKVLKVV